MIPPAAMRLPRLSSTWKLRLDMVGRTDHECLELPLCRSEAPSRDPSGGATVWRGGKPAETSHPAKATRYRATEEWSQIAKVTLHGDAGRVSASSAFAQD